MLLSPSFAELVSYCRDCLAVEYFGGSGKNGAFLKPEMLFVRKPEFFTWGKDSVFLIDVRATGGDPYPTQIFDD